MRKTAALLALCLLLTGIWAPGTAEGEFAFAAPDRIRPYRESEIVFNIPEAGDLSLWWESMGERRPLLRREGVEAGALTLPILGLSLAGEALPRGDGELIAELAIPGGVLGARSKARVLQPAAALAFAVLARETVYVSGDEDVVVDYAMSAPGMLDVALYGADAPGTALKRWSVKLNDTYPPSFRWDRRVGGKPAAPGEYALAFGVR
ncbi:MAG TPA: hypothetical protein VLA21_11920, partial [Candidatus Limnocylindria bacterium]|nr:hypothetical protein [Candidatus Limnocylindria bacterium]